MKWFDVLYHLDPVWNEKFNKYRAGECTIEEALIGGVLYFASKVDGLKEDYEKLKKALDNQSN